MGAGLILGVKVMLCSQLVMMAVQLYECTKTSELYSSEEGIEWYGNYISVKLLKIPVLLLMLVTDIIFHKTGQVAESNLQSSGRATLHRKSWHSDWQSEWSRTESDSVGDFPKARVPSFVHPEAQGQWGFQQKRLGIHDDLGHMKTDPYATTLTSYVSLMKQPYGSSVCYLFLY